jgi:two-component system, chemotaxis family, sensor kinase CheA
MEEAKGYLERIASGLLILESAPDDQAAIDAIFREAHTMKGAAGMVGMMRVSRLAHRLEDLLVELRDKKRRATPELTDAMLLVVDGLGRLIASASGTEQDTSDETALERLLPTPEPTSSITKVEPAPTPPVAATPPAASTSIPVAGVAIKTAASAPSQVATAVEPPRSQPDPEPVIQAPGASPDRRRKPAATLEVPVTRIDELNRLVGEASAAQLRVGHIFGTEMQRDPDAVTEYRELTKVINQLQEVTERTRMVPVATLEPILHRTVRDSARAAGKDVRWEMIGEEIEVDRGVLEELVSPLLHIVRNSVGHGVELPEVRLAAGKSAQATVRLQASQVGSKVVIAISDDGGGINVAAVRASAAKSGVDVTRLTEQESLQLIFRSGVSTAKVLTEDSGRGVGLDIVATAVAAVHGEVEVVNHPGLGAEFRIVVPITLTVVACLIVSIAGQSFALPLHRIIRMLDAQHIQVVGGRKLAVIDGLAVPVSNLGLLLGLPTSDEGPWVLLGTPTSAHAFQIETVLQKRDVVVRGLTGRLRELQAVSGASIEPNGSILLVLDVTTLIDRSDAIAEHASKVVDKAAEPSRKLSVMVVDDALMVRELQRSILERVGYSVRTASDGAEALAMLSNEPADLVVTDLEMPNVDGFALTSSIRAHPRLTNIPVLIVSSRASAEDHQRGLDAGADGYIVKTSFDEAGLLSAVSRLLGREFDPTFRRHNASTGPGWTKADVPTQASPR